MKADETCIFIYNKTNETECSNESEMYKKKIDNNYRSISVDGMLKNAN